MAGTYQSFGDLGHYLDQYGGMDSLSDAYKCPECYGGEWGSTEYQDGDTWYRDMRAPGFEGAEALPAAGDSLQWLASQIVSDARFAKATVKFWWPAVFGAETLLAPENRSSEGYDQELRAFAEQDALIETLAESFVSSGYDLKSLLADMVMSPWYRQSDVSDPERVAGRETELSTVGRGRLLTPEELDRKTARVWSDMAPVGGRYEPPHIWARDWVCRPVGALQDFLRGHRWGGCNAQKPRYDALDGQRRGVHGHRSIVPGCRRGL